MPSLGEVRLDQGLFTMLKGEPGTRKSTAALSYPQPQYWFSSDQKMEALIKPARQWGIKMGKGVIDFDDYNDYTKVRDKIQQFKLNCPYKTIIVDSLTSLGDNMNRETIKYKVTNKEGGKKIGNIYVPGMEEYNAEASAFQELVTDLKDVQKYHKINVILIAHVVGQRKGDEKNKLTHHSRVIITGGDKISGKISSYMTEVYHFNVIPGFQEDASDSKYSLFTEHTGNDYARTSLPLERSLVFNDTPLYTTFIAPAIAKMAPVVDVSAQPSITTSFTK